jgi:hypothetical protein
MFSSVFRSLAWLTAGLAVVATTLAVSTSRKATASEPPAKPQAASAEENPTVTPGLVKWHKSFADAKAASRQTGRPVLVFHMMGQLDKQFC